MLEVANRVGLAAEFDRNAVAINELCRLGFCFWEVGTVTPTPQPGNDRPRLFRLRRHLAQINRVGSANDGAAVMAARIRRSHFSGIVGDNIGTNADTPMVKALDDYLIGRDAFHDVASYISVNVSSPNAAELRELQDTARLEPILTGLLDRRAPTVATK